MGFAHCENGKPLHQALFDYTLWIRPNVQVLQRAQSASDLRLP